ncbi:EAL domain-containing protein [Aliivibrio sp. S4TY2]|uniref:EAL domain-containing protein n=1 Tax=unclassified Aliivibrio TaxID=2645654 RepID=UPI002378EF45|nr:MULTISPECIES: cyclic diguanylate phosphodiesterase [unclassified Aliivibrio]MDD9156197.1 EAL domain-containing protein [Aliivibrio sp. S4TY2]MDD9160544.1 EAL domain-containing protein [Aliivibrio sp. S4TY1]MDD9163905.1 EAL domain-containing protein [Aliivibrio sp. S4MY2]MDD9168120.1 EAL domain-containing protein [Aliivibrio sp. S4MY4]MDD9185101.1 EAL domain-containing protein [Aliivibrio sp. S4MY3]
MKFITNKYMVGVIIIFILFEYVIRADYQRYVESNIKNTMKNIEFRFDKAKKSVDELAYLKGKTCQEMMLPLQKKVARCPSINSISVIQDGQYFCSSIVGSNISKKNIPEKEIYIKEKNLLTDQPSISYYHRYDNDNGIQFFMKEIPVELENTRFGLISLSNSQYIISKGNIFSSHSLTDEKVYSSEKYDFHLLFKYDKWRSVESYVIDNTQFIFISLLMLVLFRILSFSSTWFNLDFYKLRNAIRKNQITPYVQPIVSAKEQIIGGEVLARWIKPCGSIISPLEFIPKMEKFGLIGEMTKSMLRQLSDGYQNSIHNGLRISVNLTESCLYDDEIYTLCEQLSKKLTLVLEFTESTEFENREKITSYMQKFRAIGVKFALDDYGTGYSSLQYLNYYEFDFIKIDKSFIDDIETNSQSLKILENIILLANNLDIKLVAEGVENKNQQQILNELQISSHQGFLYFKPMPLKDFNIVVKGK